MKVTKGLKNAISSHPSILTLGTFDGIHQGHRTIISKLTSESKKHDLKSIILTFFPHPRMVLQNNNIEMIDTIEEKQNLLKNLGVDFLIIHPFSNDFSRLTPIDFVRDILVNKFKSIFLAS